MRFFPVLMLVMAAFNANVDSWADGTQKVMFSAIVLDLDGNGIETTAAGSGEVLFDFNGDGTKNQTGWISPADGFLVYDRNDDGIINSGLETFGDNTPRYNQPGACLNGYAALAQEDTNGDGAVNHLDDNWLHLRVWRDLNQNGVTDQGELFTLSELGITGFGVTHSNSTTDQNGNSLRGQAVYHDLNGAACGFSDVWFEQDLFHSQFSHEKTPASLLNLPALNGSGKVRPILQACARSEALAKSYRRFVEAEGRRAKLALVDSLLYQWADTAGMIPTFAARASDAAAIVHNNLPMSLDEWDRILHVAESFNGRYLVDLPKLRGTGTEVITIDWSETMINHILTSYNSLRNFLYGEVAVETHLARYNGLVISKVDPDADKVTYDYSLVEYFFPEIWKQKTSCGCFRTCSISSRSRQISVKSRPVKPMSLSSRPC